MPKKVGQFVLTEQPINWKRAFASGVLSVIFMMAVIDIFNMMKITPFSFELYLGSLLLGPYSPNSWTLGFYMNLVFGGIFGIFYAYCFEYVFVRSSGRLGIWVGLWHSIVAGLAVFPFFGVIHEFLNTGLYPRFGFLGASLGAATPILLVVGHLLFGLCMGTFYGPVRIERVRTRYFEPGEIGSPGEEDVLTEDEDHPERIAA